MSTFSRSSANASHNAPTNDVDPKWNHPVTSGDIHKLEREIGERLGVIKRIQRIQSVQLGLILLGMIALIASRLQGG